MVPSKYKEFYHDAQEPGRSEGEVPMARIDDAVRAHPAREVRDGPDGSEAQPARRPAAARRAFGSAEHRAVARQAVRESLVLLKNDKQAAAARGDGQAHPRRRRRRRRYRQSRPAAGRSRGRARRGTSRPGHDDPRRDRRSAAVKTTNVTYSADGSGAAGADVGVVVDRRDAVRRKFMGDRTDLAIAADDLAAIAR